MSPRLISGDEVGGTFVESAAEQLADALGFHPFYGTLNLKNASVEEFPAQTLPGVGNNYCDGVRLRDCRVSGIRAAIIRPFTPDYPQEKTEVLAPVKLRTLFGLENGDPVPLGAPDDIWPLSQPVTDVTTLDLFDAVVFDLDGTLVDLAVDWGEVRAEIKASIGDHFDKSLQEYNPPELFHTAHEAGFFDDLAAILSAHEYTGAKEATPLDLLDVVGEISCPVGICTANSSEAAALALERFNIYDEVDAIVGRNTVQKYKPEPEPLRVCVDQLGGAQGNAVFIGDVASDAETARRAHTSFLFSGQFSTEGSTLSGS